VQNKIHFPKVVIEKFFMGFLNLKNNSLGGRWLVLDKIVLKQP
jgi:hypothetical protein